MDLKLVPRKTVSHSAHSTCDCDDYYELVGVWAPQYTCVYSDQTTWHNEDVPVCPFPTNTVNSLCLGVRVQCVHYRM